MSENAAAGVELLCLDVDGVMTDGSIHLDDNAVETKRFHVRDGTGIRIWSRLGYHVALITGRSGRAVQHRAAELGIEHVIQASTASSEAALSVLAWMTCSMPSSAALCRTTWPDRPVISATW